MTLAACSEGLMGSFPAHSARTSSWMRFRRAARSDEGSVRTVPQATNAMLTRTGARTDADVPADALQGLVAARDAQVAVIDDSEPLTLESLRGDVVVLDPSGSVVTTIVGGEVVWKS